MRKVSIFAGETSVFRKLGYNTFTNSNIRNKNNVNHYSNSKNYNNYRDKKPDKISTFNSRKSFDFIKNTKETNGKIIQIALEPTISLLKKTGFPRELIDAVIFSSCSSDQYLSSIISEILGIKPKISHRIDNLCNSGTNAIISAYSYIASGLCDSALVIGAELYDSPGRVLSSDISRGQFNLPIYWGAILKKMHMNKYGTKEEQICTIPVNNYLKAKHNQIAINHGKNLTLSQVMNSKLLVEPLRLLECCLICEGASSILLIANDKISFYKSKLGHENLRKKISSEDGSNLYNFTDDKKEKSQKEIIPICIKGLGQQNNSASFGNAFDTLFLSSPARKAANQAYEMAGIKPNDIDVVELHDAFSILEIMAYEDLGFVNTGKGGRFVEKKDPNIYINPRGGILGCGHPLGATGIAQTVEIFKQLSGTINDKYNSQISYNMLPDKSSKKNTSLHKQIEIESHDRQIRSDIKLGLVHNLAAAGTSASILILEK
ncbi:MAG: thiolase family protein [Nitrososphaeraceae archaeon]